MIVVRRALLSCSDKTGLETFAKTLVGLGVELVASGGTAQRLTKAGLPVKTVETFAGITEQLDGRVKTLHPKLYTGILARRDDPAHRAAIGEDGLIDVVVVNLYPFEATSRKPGTSLAEVVEQIDVGGVALLRAAAKNFASVAVVSDPQQYDTVAQALLANQGRLPNELARSLAVQAFELTSRYDAAIHAYLSTSPAPAPESHATASGELPETISLTLRKHQALRYGENPHQRAAWYTPQTSTVFGLGTLRQRQGKELSYNNLLDVDATLRCLLDFSEPTCAIIKHHAPCGVATAPTLTSAYERAHACDPESAFGGIVGFNRPIDVSLASALTATFLEVVVAPAIEPDAAARLVQKPNLRVVTLDWPTTIAATLEWRQLFGSWLGQEPDRLTEDGSMMRVVTERSPTEEERADLWLAWIVAKHALSNAIALASGGASVGIGQGQPSRVGSVRLAIEKAGARSQGAVVASDGFFPFADSVELLAKAGVTAVIQPGGSIRDAEVIAAANRLKIAVLFTGQRHFRH